MHEAQCHELSLFVTLTYDDAHVPEGGTLVKKHVQDFLKRLRYHHKAPLRYFAVGEYGEQSLRPHYHLVLFGIDFTDRQALPPGRRGDPLYRSPVLDQIWGMGGCTYGQVTPRSARYVAKYCLKKVNGDLAAVHYGARLPEFAVMSLKPGIGADWFERYRSDVYPSDFCVLEGRKYPPPRFYDEKLDKEELKLYKERRLRLAMKHRANQTPARLKVREEVLKARLSLKKGEL